MELIAIAILTFALGMLIVVYDQKLRELRKLRSKLSSAEELARQRAIEIVETARDRALKIIEEAKLHAGESQSVVESELEEVSQKQIDVYKQILQSISKEIEKDAQQEVQDFRKTLELETVGAQRAVAGRIEAEFTAAMQQLDEYKKQKSGEIDKKAENVLKEFTRLAMPRLLSSDEQGKLIIEALEEAKKKYGF